MGDVFGIAPFGGRLHGSHKARFPRKLHAQRGGVQARERRAHVVHVQPVELLEISPQLVGISPHRRRERD